MNGAGCKHHHVIEIRESAVRSPPAEGRRILIESIYKCPASPARRSGPERNGQVTVIQVPEQDHPPIWAIFLILGLM